MRKSGWIYKTREKYVSVFTQIDLVAGRRKREDKRLF
jgi:hypothetical protein